MDIIYPSLPSLSNLSKKGTKMYLIRKFLAVGLITLSFNSYAVVATYVGTGVDDGDPLRNEDGSIATNNNGYYLYKYAEEIISDTYMQSNYSNYTISRGADRDENGDFIPNPDRPGYVYTDYSKTTKNNYAEANVLTGELHASSELTYEVLDDNPFIVDSLNSRLVETSSSAITQAALGISGIQPSVDNGQGILSSTVDGQLIGDFGDGSKLNYGLTLWNSIFDENGRGTVWGNYASVNLQIIYNAATGSWDTAEYYFDCYRRSSYCSNDGVADLYASIGDISIDWSEDDQLWDVIFGMSAWVDLIDDPNWELSVSHSINLNPTTSSYAFMDFSHTAIVDTRLTKEGLEFINPEIDENDPNPALFSDTAQVPEPATLALFGIGLAGLGFARKKKKSA